MHSGRWIRHCPRTLFAGVVLLFCTHPAIGQDFARGARNYQAIVAGERKFDSLSPAEQQEVLLIYQASRAHGDDTGSNECRRARATAESAASDTLSYTKRLSQCVANGGLTDDCDSEFRRLRSAHDDYASAVTDVQASCR